MGGSADRRLGVRVELVDLVDLADARGPLVGSGPRGLGDAADERELVPTVGLYFLLRSGVGDLMSRGVPRWRF
jgi:hypothetical protein